MNDFDKPVTARDLYALHETFIAYGDPEASYWFVGLEENVDPVTAPSLDGFVRGLVQKTNRVRKAGKLGLNDLCGSDARTGYQTTWGAYVKLLFAIERAGAGPDLPWSLDEVRRFQKEHLGALDVPVGLPRACLMELFPLARNRRRPWPYAELSERKGLEYLRSARSYESHVTEMRASALLERMDALGPRFLMCFGNACRDVLASRTGRPLERVELRVGSKTFFVQLAQRGATTIVFARHPAARGTPNGYWVELGELLADRQNAEPSRKAA